MMRAGSFLTVPAMTAVALAACLSVGGCATPATPASVASAAASAAAPAATPPTSATVGSTTIVAVQPAAPPPAKQCTLCGFLGLDKAGQGIAGLFQRLFSRVKTALGLEGRFPGLQPVPPVLPITDPANLGPTSPPAVKAAAQAKMEEDQAPQKIQALRYLARIGCGGCYPGIEEAMLAALDDCTEAVRYEAVLALRGNGNVCCSYCRCQGCCSPAVRKKLDFLANSRDDSGCYHEPSERVRRMARVVLGACGGLVSQESAPSEGPLPTPAPPGPNGAAATSGPDTKAEPTMFLSPVQLVSFDAEASADSEHDTVLARVNGEAIFESRIVPLVEVELAQSRLRGQVVGPDQLQRLLAAQVRRAIDAKLMVQHARRDLTAAGRPFGPLTSDEVNQWLSGALGIDPYVSLMELNDYYRSRLSQFQGPSEARWEQLVVHVADFGSREKAREAAELVRSRAAGRADPTAHVDLKAVETSVVDYTTYEQIEPRVLIAALKTLPVGAASPVLEAGDELYVVRLLDRRPGKLTSFDEVMNDLRRAIMTERRRKAEEALLARLREGAEVWTAMDVGAAPSPAVPAAPPPPPGALLLGYRPLAPLPVAPSQPPLPPAAAAPMTPSTPPLQLLSASTDVVRANPTHGAVRPQVVRFDFPQSAPLTKAPVDAVSIGAVSVAQPPAFAPAQATVVPLPPVVADGPAVEASAAPTSHVAPQLPTLSPSSTIFPPPSLP